MDSAAKSTYEVKILGKPSCCWFSMSNIMCLNTIAISDYIKKKTKKNQTQLVLDELEQRFSHTLIQLALSYS